MVTSPELSHCIIASLKRGVNDSIMMERSFPAFPGRPADPDRQSQ
jgi:hypothetical protein